MAARERPKPIQFTAAEAMKVAPIVQRVQDLSRLSVNSKDRAVESIEKVLGEIANGTYSNDPDKRNSTARHIAWVLGLDCVFQYSRDMADLCGIPHDETEG